MEKSVVIILAYDPALPSYVKEHLDNAVAFCNQKQCRAIFLTGACTRGRTLPGVSEAMAIYNYIKPRLTYDPLIIQDEDAWTTIDNIKNLAAVLREEKYSFLRGNPVIVFCEASKTLVIDILCREFLNKVPTLKTGSWAMESPKLQAIMTIYAWAATKLPLLSSFLRMIRRRMLTNM